MMPLKLRFRRIELLYQYLLAWPKHPSREAIATAEKVSEYQRNMEVFLVRLNLPLLTELYHSLNQDTQSRMLENIVSSQNNRYYSR